MSTHGHGVGSGDSDSRHTPWLRQGDVFAGVTTLAVLDAAGRPQVHQARHGVVLISQTCDALRADWVHVGRVVYLSGPDLSAAKAGKSPRWAHLPALRDDAFIALDVIGTIDKSLLNESDRVPGVADLTATRHLARAIGRRYSRFAFPDDVNDFFRPLKDLAQEKAGKPNSAAGAAFARVRQIRVRSGNGWEDPPFDLGVTFLLDAGEVPFLDDVVRDAALEQWLEGRNADAIATRLAAGVPAEQERLWRALIEEWIERCTRRGPSVVVASVSVDLATADEYPVSSYWDSEALDLDHLSSSSLSV